MYPIIGHRYKCIICHNFDFCEACEGKGDHPHAFLKIRNPAQAPKVLVATMEDPEREGLEVNGKFLDVGALRGLVQSFIPNIPEAIHRFKNCMRRGRHQEKPADEEKVEK